MFDKTRLWLMWSINRDILIRSLCLEIIVVSFLFMGADFGDVTLAANQVLLQFLMIASHGLDGFAFAAEAMVGQAFGARKRHELRRATLFLLAGAVSPQWFWRQFLRFVADCSLI